MYSNTSILQLYTVLYSSIEQITLHIRSSTEQIYLKLVHYVRSSIMY